MPEVPTQTIVRLKPLKIPAVYSVQLAETGKPVGADTIRPKAEGTQSPGVDTHRGRQVAAPTTEMQENLPVTGGTKHDGKANAVAWLPLEGQRASSLAVTK